MGWLTGSKAKEEEAPKPKPETREQKKEREFLEAKEHLPEAIAKVEAERDAQWERVQDEHLRDRETYALTAKRHGDFLLLSLTRSMWTYGDPDKLVSLQKSAVAVNLSATKRIAIKHGHAPDHEGEIEFYHDYFGFDGGTNNVAFRSRNIFDLPSRAFIGDDYMGHESYISEYDKSLDAKLTGLPRFAESDSIMFIGTETSLSIPFGLADEIMVTIFNAIREGYEPPAIPTGE